MIRIDLTVEDSRIIGENNKGLWSLNFYDGHTGVQDVQELTDNQFSKVISCIISPETQSLQDYQEAADSLSTLEPEVNPLP